MKLMPKNKGRLWFIVALSIIVLTGGGLAAYLTSAVFDDGGTSAPSIATIKKTPRSTEVPTLTTKEVVGGLANVWDVGFLPDKTMIFTERKGTVKAFVNGETRTLADIPDVYTRGEGGLMGLEVDRKFSENRFIYTCFNSSKVGLDVRLVRWKVNADTTTLENRQDIIIGMPSNESGRHSGCRPRMDMSDVLWVGTGDIAVGTNAQDPKSLGGKILRIDRDGKGVPGNMTEPFDNRIYSYGHRNTQGIAFLPKPKNGLVGYSTEHGSFRDDEVNELRAGNFGWNPVPGYNESVAMTDKEKYPDAVDAIWRSGTPTIAPSGATILSGKQWKAWDGALAMAVLKDKHVRILRFDENNKLLDESVQLNSFGRVRSAVLGPDGLLYITTDNSNNDAIVVVSPT